MYSTRIMFLEPAPSIPPRPMIFRRGLSSMKLARRVSPDGAGMYWLATRWASICERFWARTAAPREPPRGEPSLPPLLLLWDLFWPLLLFCRGGRPPLLLFGRCPLPLFGLGLFRLFSFGCIYFSPFLKI